MAPLCLISSIWEERNVRNFEACKTSAEEQTNFMFKSLYTWIVAHNSPRISIFFRIFGFFVLIFLFNRGVSQVYFQCTRIVPLYPFNEIDLLNKK